MKTALTAARLRELLHYDPETGLFTRKSGRYAGSTIFSRTNKEGYQRFCVECQRNAAHRWAWLYMMGEYPACEMEIDHINGDKLDNRWCNLRSVSVQANQQNRTRPNRTNKLGVLGVTENQGKYRASITVDGKVKNLGSYHSISEAEGVYLAAKRRMHIGCMV